MYLRRRQAGAAGVGHGLDHVGNQPADFRGPGVGHGCRLAEQHRMAHACNLENRHASKYVQPDAEVKR